MIACILSQGCHKGEVSKDVRADTSSAPTNTADVSQVQPETPDVLQSNQPLPPPPPPSPVVLARSVNNPRAQVVGEADPVLTAELRSFVEQKKRLPQSFAEFATVRLDSIPRPPAGKKWVIDTDSLEVKAVAQ